MNAFRFTLEIRGRQVSVITKLGVLATMEAGDLADNGSEIPRDKLTLLLTEGNAGQATAWAQLCEYTNGRALVTHEGWISNEILSAAISGSGIKASLHEESLTPELKKCLSESEAGTFSCCTANGNGCYVKCCNGCCSDSTRCPGASCCP